MARSHLANHLEEEEEEEENSHFTSYGKKCLRDIWFLNLELSGTISPVTGQRIF